MGEDQVLTSHAILEVGEFPFFYGECILNGGCEQVHQAEHSAECVAITVDWQQVWRCV